MTRSVLAVAACSIACVTVQDLGEDRRPEPAAAAPQFSAPRIVATEIAPEREPGSCPGGMPRENTACNNLAWCSYPLEGGSGLAAKCGCSLGLWTCLRVRDDHRANVVEPGALPLTAAACTEGAPCQEGTSCSLGKQRRCECTSAARLRCRVPIN